MSLEMVKIGQIGKVITGTTPPTKVTEYFNGKFPFIKPSDLIDDSRVAPPTQMTLSEMGKSYILKNLLPPETTCVVTIGTIGKLAFTTEESFTNQQINAIIPNPNFNNKYVFYLIKNNMPYIKAANGGSSSGRENVSKSKFCNIEFPYISNLPKQKRIADILSAYDDLIENNLKRIKLLEETAQTIYREWFVNFRFPGYEDAEFGEDGVPVGWERKTIGDVCEVITGKTPPKKEPRNYGKGFPFIKTPDMHNSLFVTTTSEEISDYGAESVHKKIIPKYSIMVSCIGSAGAVGVTQRDSITNQQINSMVLKTKFDFTYLTCFAKTLKSHLENIGSNGATMTNVNKEKFSNIELLYPSEALREKFFATSNPIFLQCQLLVNEVQKLSEARDILLPRLMNRTIEVGL